MKGFQIMTLFTVISKWVYRQSHRCRETAFFIAFLMIYGCSPKNAEEMGAGGEGYRIGKGVDIIDTRYWSNSRDNVFWVDEHAVLFTGFESGRYVHYEPHDLEKPDQVVLIWDSKREELYNPHAPEFYRVTWCRIGDSYLTIALSDSGKGEMYLRKLTRSVGGYEFQESDAYSVREIARSRSACLIKIDQPIFVDDYEISMKMPNAELYLARNRHNFSNIRIYKNKEEYIHDLNDYLIESHTLEYSDNFGSYYFLAKSKNSIGRFHIIHIDKESVRISALPVLPDDSFSEYFSMKSTKRGVVFNQTIKLGNADVRGLFLWRGQGEIELLVEGSVGPVAVSPSGCKIAFSHAPSSDYIGWIPENAQTLKIIDLCSNG